MGVDIGSGDSLDILRIARAIYPDSVGGGSIHAHSISKLQSEMGHNVTIITTDRGDATLPRVERRAGYTIKRYRENLNLFGNSITLGVLWGQLLDTGDYDILHAHSHLSFISNLAAVSARRNDAPLVVTNHGVRSQTAPDWVQKLYLPTVGRFTFNSADTVFTYSNEEQAELRQLGVSAPISVIHNGVDCTKFAPDGGSRESMQLLFVGRLRETKGPQIVLDILAELGQEYPELTLKMAGDGPLRGQLEQTIAENGLARKVELLGEVENDAMPELYNESALFVLPTAREGVPRTILEAMACGLPVVTTDLPQIEPVVDNCGVMVERETEAFSNAIDKLLASPEKRETLGKRGTVTVRENYSWQDTVRKTTEKYYEVIQEKGVAECD